MCICNNNLRQVMLSLLANIYPIIKLKTMNKCISTPYIFFKVDMCTYSIFSSGALYNKLCAFAKKCINLIKIKLRLHFEDDKSLNIAIITKILEEFSNITNVKIFLAEMVYNYNADNINLLCSCLRRSLNIKISASDDIIFRIVESIKYNDSIKYVNLAFTSVKTLPSQIPITAKNKWR